MKHRKAVPRRPRSFSCAAAAAQSRFCRAVVVHFLFGKQLICPSLGGMQVVGLRPLRGALNTRGRGAICLRLYDSRGGGGGGGSRSR